MKTSMIAFFSILITTSSARAVHMYASYDCKAGPLTLRYDGPGSNYAVGGFSNFYVEGKDGGSLAHESSEDGSEAVGSPVTDDGKLQVLFRTIDTRDVTEPKTDSVDPSACEGFDYDHTEWKTTRTIRIDAISAEASAKLGLKAGDQFTMACDETMDEPIRCDRE